MSAIAELPSIAMEGSEVPVILSAAKDLSGAELHREILRCAQDDGCAAIRMTLAP
jgi:hypothetical protein